MGLGVHAAVMRVVERAAVRQRCPPSDLQLKTPTYSRLFFTAIEMLIKRLSKKNVPSMAPPGHFLFVRAFLSPGKGRQKKNRKKQPMYVRTLFGLESV
jgi:hypothetical protein